MSCPAIKISNTDRNIDEVKYLAQRYGVVLTPNLPISSSSFPYVDTRQVRIMPPIVRQPTIIDVPEYNMRYTYGCTNCIRNRNVIFSP